MSAQFKLTPEERRRIAGHDGYNAIDIMEEIVASRWPRWIPITERMPTAEEGMKGSTLSTDGRLVCWMMEVIGVTYGSWCSPPTGAIAWCRIPDYEPPVPTPEDPVRLAFEKWVITELDDQTERYENGKYVSENVRCAWAAWQAARADAGKPEPVREDIRKLLQAFDDSRKAAAAGTLCKTLERESRELISTLRAALTGGQQP